MNKLPRLMVRTVWIGHGRSFWHASNRFATYAVTFVDLATWNALDNCAYFGLLAQPLMFRIHEEAGVYLVRTVGFLSPGELNGFLCRSLWN